MDNIYEDNNILVINKPAGIESVPSSNKGSSLLEKLKQQSTNSTILPVHRLDRDTSGVIVFAKNPTTLTQLEELFKERQTTKLYLAICNGIPRNPEGIIRRNLSKWSGGHRPVKIVKGGGGLTAETKYKVLCVNKTEQASLIVFSPQQGRTHQIRVHAEAFGRPIIGDNQYGNRDINRKIKELTGLKRQALHAWRLTLPTMLPDKTDQILTAPLPQDLTQTCNVLFDNWIELLESGVNHEI